MVFLKLDREKEKDSHEIFLAQAQRAAASAVYTCRPVIRLYYRSALYCLGRASRGGKPAHLGRFPMLISHAFHLLVEGVLCISGLSSPTSWASSASCSPTAPPLPWLSRYGGSARSSAFGSCLTCLEASPWSPTSPCWCCSLPASSLASWATGGARAGSGPPWACSS